MDHKINEYDRQRQQELNSANMPLFWGVFVVLAVAVMVYLATHGGM